MSGPEVPPPRQLASIRDVARIAGVSRQTVSRVINSHPSLRPETRDRVQAVIDQLQYRPNRVAQALGANRSQTIGVLAFQRSQYGPAAAIQGIEKRADTLLSANYTKADLDGVLSPNDTLARAVIAAVKGAGKPVPVITGQDSEVESVKSIMKGEQYSTINKDTRKLVAATIEMVNALQAGGEPKITDPDEYDNGVKKVPANLLPPVIVTKENAAEAYKDDPTLKPLTEG